jgi:hypothetical protein
MGIQCGLNTALDAPYMIMHMANKTLRGTLDVLLLHDRRVSLFSLGTSPPRNSILSIRKIPGSISCASCSPSRRSPNAKRRAPNLLSMVTHFLTRRKPTSTISRSNQLSLLHSVRKITNARMKHALTLMLALETMILMLTMKMIY